MSRVTIECENSQVNSFICYFVSIWS